MNRKSVYYKAAILIAEGKKSLACDAIGTVMGSYYTNRRIAFEMLFKPTEQDEWNAWYGTKTKNNQLARSLALLFLAEMENEYEKLF